MRATEVPHVFGKMKRRNLTVVHFMMKSWNLTISVQLVNSSNMHYMGPLGKVSFLGGEWMNQLLSNYSSSYSNLGTLELTHVNVSCPLTGGWLIIGMCTSDSKYCIYNSSIYLNKCIEPKWPLFWIEFGPSFGWFKPQIKGQTGSRYTI